MNKKKIKIDVIPTNILTFSKKKYKYLIQKYGSAVINSGVNLIIVDEQEEK